MYLLKKNKRRTTQFHFTKEETTEKRAERFKTAPRFPSPQGAITNMFSALSDAVKKLRKTLSGL